VKIVGEISIPIVEAVPTTEPPEYSLWPSTVRLLSTVELIEKKERKKVHGHSLRSSQINYRMCKLMIYLILQSTNLSVQF